MVINLAIMYSRSNHTNNTPLFEVRFLPSPLLKQKKRLGQTTKSFLLFNNLVPPPSPSRSLANQTRRSKNNLLALCLLYLHRKRNFRSIFTREESAKLFDVLTSTFATGRGCCQAMLLLQALVRLVNISPEGSVLNRNLLYFLLKDKLFHFPFDLWYRQVV